MICRRYGEALDDAAQADDAKFVRLQNELVDNLENLFVFVRVWVRGRKARFARGAPSAPTILK